MEKSGFICKYSLIRFWQNAVMMGCSRSLMNISGSFRALEFIDTVINVENISAGLWSSFNATRDHHNHNCIPFDMLTKTITNDFDRQSASDDDPLGVAQEARSKSSRLDD